MGLVRIPSQVDRVHSEVGCIGQNFLTNVGLVGIPLGVGSIGGNPLGSGQDWSEFLQDGSD